MEKIKKTNAARSLDQKHIAYELIPYPVDENDLGAEHVAATLNEPVERVCKTILVRGDKTGPIIGVVPGHLEIFLKGLAKVSQNKSVETVPLKELLPLTGYIRGGCTAIGMKKQYVTRIDNSAKALEKMIVSGGKLGMQLELAPKDLAEAACAEFDDITAH